MNRPCIVSFLGKFSCEAASLKLHFLNLPASILKHIKTLVWSRVFFLIVCLFVCFDHCTIMAFEFFFLKFQLWSCNRWNSRRWIFQHPSLKALGRWSEAFSVCLSVTWTHLLARVWSLEPKTRGELLCVAAAGLSFTNSDKSQID